MKKKESRVIPTKYVNFNALIQHASLNFIPRNMTGASTFELQTTFACIELNATTGR